MKTIKEMFNDIVLLFDNKRFQKVVSWVLLIMIIGFSIGSVIGYILQWWFL